jgi:hypothetical protein
MSRVIHRGATFALQSRPNNSRRARRLAVIALALGPLVVTARAASAQSAGEQSAYVALIYTPVSGLPPLPPVTDSLGRKDGITLLGRLGHTSRDGGALTLTTYAFGVEVPRGRLRLGATLGYLSASCGFEWQGDDECAGDIMIGGSVRSWITSRSLDGGEPPKRGKGASSSSAGKLVVGFDGNVGYSPRQGETALAIGASVPTALALQSGTVRITPFLAPGVAYGRLGRVAYEEDDGVPTSHGAITFVIGGGVGLQFGTSGIGANVGFQRVLKSAGGATQLGIGMTWRGLTAAR